MFSSVNHIFKTFCTYHFKVVFIKCVPKTQINWPSNCTTLYDKMCERFPIASSYVLLQYLLASWIDSNSYCKLIVYISSVGVQYILAILIIM